MNSTFTFTKSQRKEAEVFLCFLERFSQKIIWSRVEDIIHIEVHNINQQDYNRASIFYHSFF